MFEWQVRGEPALRQVVNFPLSESDLRALPPEAETSEAGISVNGNMAIREFSEGTELWPYLLLAGVALVIIEGGFLWLATRS